MITTKTNSCRFHLIGLGLLALSGCAGLGENAPIEAQVGKGAQLNYCIAPF